MHDSLDAAIPPLYAPWLRDIAGGPIPAETVATCDRCVMLPTEEPRTSTATFFNPITKCCTYQPTLPNFLAGRILADADPLGAEGRSTLERRIAQRASVSPFGVSAGRIFTLMYVHTREAFGRAPALKCPHLTDSGTCGIWRHRPGVCATWYCKHVRGETASRFWRLTNKLLRELETELAIWCTAELHVGAAEFSDLDEERADRPDVAELDGPLDQTRYQRIWGEWAGREEEFYRLCANLVEPLDWQAVQGICSPRVRVLADLVRDAYEHLTSEAIPARLRCGSFQIVDARDGKYWVVSYSGYDPLVMPESLAAVLHYFDGRPTEEALAAILVARNIRIDLSLVRRMVDFGVLQAV
jgi:hypothetical protein